ncbi:MAG TPA: putative Ig domain-containing protein [Desulfatiglandales bacterium]|nr:putative Ig domain-containing protein [Desulfatiglandales bacterium]
MKKNTRILTLMFLVAFLPLLVGCLPSPAPPITENQAPLIVSTPVTTAKVGVEYIYNVTATDPDEDTLTYSLTVKPKGMTINSTTGVINWKPLCNQAGDNLVIVEVSDGALSDTQSFTIKVGSPPAPPVPPVNHAPIITSIPGLTAIVGVEYTYTIKATDQDGDTITYSLMDGPGGMTFDGTATINWTPTSLQIGANDVIVKASDGKSGKKDITQSFTIIVEDFPSIVIDGILSPSEWDRATEIPVEGTNNKGSIESMGTVRVLATVDYLYVSFDVLDSTDARFALKRADDEASININPTHGELFGMPCDIIFKTGANPAVWGTSSGQTDDWETEWRIDGVQQQSLPRDLETITLYDGENRVSEWKIPLVSIAPSVGDVLKVGGSISIDYVIIDVPVYTNYVYPIDLDPLWSDASTYKDIYVY